MVISEKTRLKTIAKLMLLKENLPEKAIPKWTNLKQIAKLNVDVIEGKSTGEGDHRADKVK